MCYCTYHRALQCRKKRECCSLQKLQQTVVERIPCLIRVALPFYPLKMSLLQSRGNGTCAHSLNKRGVIVWCCLLQGYRKWPAIMQQEKTLFLRLFGEKRLANQSAQRLPSDPTTQRRRSPVSPEANKIFLRCCAIFIRLRSFVLYSVLYNQSALV